MSDNLYKIKHFMPYKDLKDKGNYFKVESDRPYFIKLGDYQGVAQVTSDTREVLDLKDAFDRAKEYLKTAKIFKNKRGYSKRLETKLAQQSKQFRDIFGTEISDYIVSGNIPIKDLSVAIDEQMQKVTGNILQNKMYSNVSSQDFDKSVEDFSNLLMSVSNLLIKEGIDSTGKVIEVKPAEVEALEKSLETFKKDANDFFNSGKNLNRDKKNINNYFRGLIGSRFFGDIMEGVTGDKVLEVLNEVGKGFTVEQMGRKKIEGGERSKVDIYAKRVNGANATIKSNKKNVIFDFDFGISVKMTKNLKSGTRLSLVDKTPLRKIYEISNLLNPTKKLEKKINFYLTNALSRQSGEAASLGRNYLAALGSVRALMGNVEHEFASIFIVNGKVFSSMEIFEKAFSQFTNSNSKNQVFFKASFKTKGGNLQFTSKTGPEESYTEQDLIKYYQENMLQGTVSITLKSAILKGL